MKISVIIPTYKPQNYIYDCLDSLYNQTIPKDFFEVIIVLNGCNEPYKSQLELYIGQHSEINWRLFQTDTGGVSNARNLGLDAAAGEYIAFIDDDDYISPCYLKELFSVADKNTIPLCYPLSFIDGTNEYTPYYITKSYDYLINQSCQISYKKAKRFFGGPVYKLIHKDIIGDRRFNLQFKNSEDSLFMFLISDKFDKVALTSKDAIYFRRLRKDSAINKKRKTSEVLKNVLCVIKEYFRIYFTAPSDYDFSFFVSRCLGQLHILLHYLKK